MGYEVHHTIVVSFWNIKLLRKTWREAKKVFGSTVHHVSNITPPVNNGEQSYFIAPDGSKRSWEDSLKGWEARKEFIEYLKELKPYSPDWVLVQFADDELDTKVIDSSDHYDCRKNYYRDWDLKAPRPEYHGD